jgi:drug/metabolite transporter (DMT)-like permease
VTASISDRIASRFPFHLIALGVLFYATGPVLARSSDTTGVLISFWRLWFGVGVLAIALIIHWLTGRDVGSKRGVQWAMVAGGAFSLNQVLFFTAIKRTSVVDASLMSTLAPVVVAFFAIPLFGERPAPMFRVWSMVAMAGAAFVILGSSAGPDGDPLGMLMAMGSTICFAGFFLISKLSRDDLAVVTFLTTVMGTAAVLVSAFVLLAGFDPMGVGASDLWTALAMAIIPGTLGHVAMTWPLNYIPANVPPLMRLAGPVVSGSLAWVTLGEGITWVHLVGGAIIVSGLAGAIRSKAGQNLVQEARTGEAAT